jgi:hypothetical protein
MSDCMGLAFFGVPTIPGIVTKVISVISVVFSTWFAGRQGAKTVHWTVKSVDNYNKLHNKTNISVVNSFPEPLYSTYMVSTYIYPDWDSNYARVGVVLQDSGYGALFLSFSAKSKFSVPIFGYTLIHETIRDKGIIVPLEEAKKSGIGECKYNISVVAKTELEEIFSQSPEWYMMTHIIGERIIIPIAHGVIDGNVVKSVLSCLAVGGAYVAQDLTRFQLLAKDGREVIEYLNTHPQCVFKPVNLTLESTSQEVVGEDISNGDL